MVQGTVSHAVPETDLTQRISEQLGPIIETLQGRIRTDLKDRDKAAIAFTIGDAATAGARVAYAAMAANAVEAGISLPPGFSLAGLRSRPSIIERPEVRARREEARNEEATCGISRGRSAGGGGGVAWGRSRVQVPVWVGRQLRHAQQPRVH